ncbi:MAG: hypothetical protein ACTHKJ_03330 [Candidatus Nitrosocosmicus sp.]
MKNINNINTDEAVDRLAKSEQGVHYMIIYQDLATLRKFYSNYTKKQIEDNNESILINPFYETTDDVRQVLSNNVNLNVFKYEKEETLSIKDALEIYFGKETDAYFKKRMAIRSKEIGKDNFSIMNDIGAYPFKGKDKELVEYELSLPKVFDLPLKRFCIFHQKDFDRLLEEQKQKLIDHHGMTIILDK